MERNGPSRSSRLRKTSVSPPLAFVLAQFLLLSPTLTLAQSLDTDERFQLMDRNADGRLDRDEVVRDGRDARTGARFRLRPGSLRKSSRWRLRPMEPVRTSTIGHHRPPSATIDHWGADMAACRCTCLLTSGKVLARRGTWSNFSLTHSNPVF